MMWTDHFGNAGVPGDDEYQARLNREDDASATVRAPAVKYNCELVDVRVAWKAYLDTHDLRNTDLLRDNVHLNEHGKALMTAILLRHFRLNLHARNDWMNTVRSYEAKRPVDEGTDDEITFTGGRWRFRGSDAIGDDPDSALKLDFVGNRVDVVPGVSQALDLGIARILIDAEAGKTEWWFQFNGKDFENWIRGLGIPHESVDGLELARGADEIYREVLERNRTLWRCLSRHRTPTTRKAAGPDRWKAFHGSRRLHFGQPRLESFALACQLQVMLVPGARHIGPFRFPID